MTNKIVKLTKRHIDQMAIIDSESDRELSKKKKLSRFDLKVKLHARFDKDEEFFGYKQDGELIGYITLDTVARKTTWFAVKQKDESKKIDQKLTKYVNNILNS